MKKIITIALALVFALTLSTVNPAQMKDASEGAVVNAEGSVVGYTYGGLYWEADEYEEMVASTSARSFEISSSSDSDSSDALTEEDAQLIEEVTKKLGMAIAVEEDEAGNKITLLGGYKFVEADGTNLDALKRMLETWNEFKSPYMSAFFSPDLTYKTIKVADGAQGIEVDVENMTIIFSVNADINELEYWDILASMRTAVNSVNAEIGEGEN